MPDQLETDIRKAMGTGNYRGVVAALEPLSKQVREDEEVPEEYADTWKEATEQVEKLLEAQVEEAMKTGQYKTISKSLGELAQNTREMYGRIPEKYGPIWKQATERLMASVEIELKKLEEHDSRYKNLLDLAKVRRDNYYELFEEASENSPLELTPYIQECQERS